MTFEGFMRGTIMLVTFSTFLGICFWAYRPANRTRFEDDGLLAFEDDEIEELQSSSENIGPGKSA
jgi:cbb3-type cytochrome oxidase subunit 3